MPQKAGIIIIAQEPVKCCCWPTANATQTAGGRTLVARLNEATNYCCMQRTAAQNVPKASSQRVHVGEELHWLFRYCHIISATHCGGSHFNSLAVASFKRTHPPLNVSSSNRQSTRFLFLVFTAKQQEYVKDGNRALNT